MFEKIKKWLKFEKINMKKEELINIELNIRKEENEYRRIFIIDPIMKRLEKLRPNTWDQLAIDEMCEILFFNYKIQDELIDLKENEEYKKMEKYDGLKYEKLYKLVNELYLADKALKKKSEAYWTAINPTRRIQTTLMARKEVASEWFGKCESELEKYINKKIIDNVFDLTFRDK